MTTRITALLIISLIFSNIAWATSFEGLNCHEQNTGSEHITDHESISSDDCCESNLIVLPNFFVQHGHTGPENYKSKVFNNTYSYFDNPEIPPPIS